MTTSHTPDVTAHLSLPGYHHDFRIHGHPAASTAYDRGGHPAVDLLLGDGLDGAPGQPHLIVETEAELDELEYAVQQMRARWSMWFADHRGSAA